MNNTIVTACNKSYLWGAYLLIASIRLNQGLTPIHVLVSGLNTDEIKLLEQFERVKVIVANSPFMHLEKPSAIMSAETEYITWVDADCIVIGNVDKLLIPAHQGLQIRFREKEENASVFSKRYSRDDSIGDIPKNILKSWQKDVNERQFSRVNKQCVTNFISLHRRHLPFIQKWQTQIERVCVKPSQPVNRHSKAYFMTDESILSSLFSFSHKVPELSGYELNKDPHNFLMHFGQSGKPWIRWRQPHLKFYDYVMAILDKLRDQHYTLPKLPYSLDLRYKVQTHLVTYLYQYYLNARHTTSSILFSIR